MLFAYTLRRDEKPQISLAVISKRLRQSLTIGERLFMDKQSQLPEFDVIQAAVRGEQWAIDKVVAHYGDFINEQSAVGEKQPDGSVKRVVDEELRQRIIDRLIREIPNFPMPQS